VYLVLYFTVCCCLSSLSYIRPPLTPSHPSWPAAGHLSPEWNQIPGRKLILGVCVVAAEAGVPGLAVREHLPAKTGMKQWPNVPLLWKYLPEHPDFTVYPHKSCRAVS